MNGEKRQTIKIRIISVCFAVVVLAIFKPFGLDVWQWQAYAHLIVVGVVPAHQHTARLAHDMPVSSFRAQRQG